MSYDVNALAVYNNELIAAGGFSTAGEINANCIARWNGSDWLPLGSGMGEPAFHHFSPIVFALCVYDGELIAAGDFGSAGGVPARRIAAWNGTRWRALGTGTNGVVYALTPYDGELVVGGSFFEAGSVPANKIARWNGEYCQPLGTGIDGNTSRVAALAVYHGELIVGGAYPSAGGNSAHGIASWNGTDWQSLGSGMGAPPSYSAAVYALVPYGTDLIAAGGFTMAGGVDANYIARWSGANWQPLDAGLSAVALALSVHDSNLIAGGGFTMAGARASAYMARWGPPRPEITESPTSQQVHPGREVSFSVTATSESAMAYQWRKDGVALADYGRIEGAQTPTLRIRRATPADRGAYDVVVTNPCGAAMSDPATLDVQAHARK
jgi:hypothetical protein